VVKAGRVTASNPARSRRRRSHLALSWCGLVCPVFPICLPAPGSGQRAANSSREGTARRRFRPSWRISQLLSEFALLGSMDLASKVPHTSPGSWGPSHILRQILAQKQGTGMGKSGGDRDSSRAVVCRTQALREYSRGGHHRHGNARSFRRFALPKETLPAATTVTRLLRLRVTALSAMLSPSNHGPSGPRLSTRPKSCKTAIP
jgi:hypothetical protein